MSKREVITTSRSLENKIKNAGSRKIFLFQTAKKLVEPHVPITDLDAFASGFRNYLYEGLKKRSKGALDSLGYEKIIGIYEMGDLDQRLRTMEIEYKKLSNIKLNKDYSGLAPYDCNVYTENEDEVKTLPTDSSITFCEDCYTKDEGCQEMDSWKFP